MLIPPHVVAPLRSGGRGLLAAAALLLCAAPARASVTSITLNPQVTRVASDGTTTYSCPGRPSLAQDCAVNGAAQGIGYHDCVDDSELKFSLAIPGLPDSTVNMQVWAGTGDCTQAGATNNASTGICWPVAASPTLSNPLILTVRVADIVKNLGVAPPPQVYTPAVAATACGTAASNSTTTTVTDDAGNTTSTAGESTVTVYFMIFQNGQTGTAPLASANYSTKVKLVGPNACTNVTAGAGDGLLIVNWSPPAGDTTVQGFDLYASPSGAVTSEGGTTLVCDGGPGGTDLLDDAGNPVLDDAGNPILVDDAGNPVSADAGCVTENVPPATTTCNGSTGSIDVSNIVCGAGSSDGGVALDAGGSAGVCAQINGATNAKGTISGVDNGTTYAVAVAAFDQYGNTGAVSSAVCDTPKPVKDFWTTYNEAGGNAFCALTVVGKHGSGVAAGLVSLVGVMWLRRRRRTPRRSTER